MKLKCFESTDSNGTEQYLIPLEDGSFIAVPKERIEHRQNGAVHGCVDKLDLIEAPSIDIVRCGECKYRDKHHYCAIWGQPYLCNDECFCSYGERREP